ncbi:MAG: hypothetical protein ABI836_13555 [Gemmatimonadota bacterium]
MTRHTRSFVAMLALGAAACGISLGTLFEEHPAHPLDRFASTSDAWVDSAGGLRGSFVGEGTSHAVHLISTDTGLIADLVRRYRPDIIHGDFWTSLSRAGTVLLDPVALQSQNNAYRPLVGSPEGHVEVQLTGVLARGSRCGWRGAQAELIVVSPPHDTDVPGLRGPVVGSFRLKQEVGDRQLRRAPPVPSSFLITTLLDRTRHAMDSTLNARLYQRDRPLTRVGTDDIPVNSLLDVDAADVVPLRTTGGQTRYAVSLRERRVTASHDTTLAAIVMIWDSAGTWQQTVLDPTLLRMQRGRMTPFGDSWTAVYWRRLQAVSGFEYPRDYLWMEQVDPRDGSVLWGILDPSGNVVVAAAEMQGPCIQ